MPTTQPSGPGGRIRGIVDRSVAMALFRRLTGRRAPSGPTATAATILSEDEVAYRIGAADTRPARPVAPVTP